MVSFCISRHSSAALTVVDVVEMTVARQEHRGPATTMAVPAGNWPSLSRFCFCCSDCMKEAQNLMAVARTRRRFQHVQRPTRGVVAEDTAFAALLARPPRWRDVDEFAERSAHEVCMADGGGAA